MGVGEASPDADKRDPADLKLQQRIEAVARQGDRGTIVTALRETFSTGFELAMAAQGFGWDDLISREIPRDEMILRIVDQAAAEGRLAEFLGAALGYAPHSPLRDYIERGGASVEFPSPRVADRLDAVESELIFNRAQLRRFIARLPSRSYGNRLWLVNGPPGSGKSATLRIARRFAAESFGPNSINIAHLALDPLATPRWLAHALFRVFNWRWEDDYAAGEPGSAAINRRYAQMIIDRLGRLDQKGRKELLVLEQREPGARPAPDLFDMISQLSAPTGPAIIYIGASEDIDPPPRGAAAAAAAAVELLENLSRDDIREGLLRFMRDHGIRADPNILVDMILRGAEGAERFNAEVSRLARDLLRPLMRAAPSDRRTD